MSCKRQQLPPPLAIPSSLFFDSLSMSDRYFYQLDFAPKCSILRSNNTKFSGKGSSRLPRPFPAGEHPSRTPSLSAPILLRLSPPKHTSSKFVTHTAKLQHATAARAHDARATPMSFDVSFLENPCEIANSRIDFILPEPRVPELHERTIVLVCIYFYAIVFGTRKPKVQDKR